MYIYVWYVYMYMYIYVYIHVCIYVCVCVCVSVRPEKLTTSLYPLCPSRSSSCGVNPSSSG